MLAEFLGVATLLISCGALLLAYRTTRRVEKSMDSAAALFEMEIEGEGENQVLHLNPKVEAVMRGLGATISQSLKMSFLGQMSGNARLDKGLKAAIMQDTVENNFPLLDLIDQFTGRHAQKYIRKNPDSIERVLRWAAPMFQQAQSAQRNDGKERMGVM